MSHSYYVSPEDYAIAELNGISQRLLSDRVYYFGWSKERAMHEPPKNMKKDYGGYDLLAEKNGISKTVFINRVQKGWTVERAATQKVMTKKEAVKCANDARRGSGRFTSVQLKEAQENGIKRLNLYRRTRCKYNDGLGWSIEKAVSTPTMQNEESLKLARAKSPFKKMNESAINMSKQKRILEESK